MNYEELLESKSPLKAKLTRMPIGNFKKEQMGEKLENVVEIRSQLIGNAKFSEALEADCEKNKVLIHKHQLHF